VNAQKRGRLSKLRQVKYAANKEKLLYDYLKFNEVLEILIATLDRRGRFERIYCTIITKRKLKKICTNSTNFAGGFD
jgi:hypothetical protein